MSRDRIEDLGRLAVLIENMLENSIFLEERTRPKYFYDWFLSQTAEKQSEILERFLQGLDVVEGRLIEALEIARGLDSLNNQDRDG
jgi:hypothetical protein